MLKKISIKFLTVILILFTFAGCTQTKMTSEQSIAVQEARNYIKKYNYSKTRYVKYIEDNFNEKKYSMDDLYWALDYLENRNKFIWNESAYDAVVHEIRMSEKTNTDYYSRITLTNTMEKIFGFTSSEIEYALDKAEKNGVADWKKFAVRAGQEYLIDNDGVSRKKLIKGLQNDEMYRFTKEESEYAVDYLSKVNLVDWHEQVVEYAYFLLDLWDIDKMELEETFFINSGFTDEEIQYALKVIHKN